MRQVFMGRKEISSENTTVQKSAEKPSSLKGRIQLQTFIKRLLKKIHPPLSATHSFSDINNPSIYYEETNYKGMPYYMPLIIIKTQGCSWYLNSGCTMCGYSIESTLGKKVADEDLKRQIEYALSFIKLHRFPMIHITSTGSFFDDQEFPFGIRIYLYEQLRNLDFLEAVNTESRAEFLLDKDRLKEELRLLEDVGFSIGMGLESSDDFIRECCINKNLEKETYLKALNVLKQLGIHTTTYVLIKPPFLTEEEAINDAVTTIKWTVKEGTDLVVAMLVNIQPYSLLHWLWQRKMYRVPWLWSAVEILDRLCDPERKKVIITGLRAVPTPLEVAHNCSKCNDEFVNALISWRLDSDFSYVENLKRVSCECKLEWERELHAISSPLEERLMDYYGYIEKEIV